MSLVSTLNDSLSNPFALALSATLDQHVSTPSQQQLQLELEELKQEQAHEPPQGEDGGGGGGNEDGDEEEEEEAGSTVGTGIWTKEEHARFLEAIKIYPNGPWKLVSAYVATRTVRQTMTHAQKYRQKAARRLRGLRTKQALMRMHYGHRIAEESLVQERLRSLAAQVESASASAKQPLYTPPGSSSSASSSSSSASTSRRRGGGGSAALKRARSSLAAASTSIAPAPLAAQEATASSASSSESLLALLTGSAAPTPAPKRRRKTVSVPPLSLSSSPSDASAELAAPELTMTMTPPATLAMSADALDCFGLASPCAADALSLGVGAGVNVLELATELEITDDLSEAPSLEECADMLFDLLCC